MSMKPRRNPEPTEVDERLLIMEPEGDKLRAQGVPIDKRPLHGDIAWSIQFQFQADTDPTGKDLECCKAHEQQFRSLE